MDTREAFNNLNPIALFAGCILPIVATPIGIGVAFIVRRMMPLANILIATILAGYIVCVVILFALLQRLLSDTIINIYGTATISLVAAAGIIFFLVFVVRRKLYTQKTVLEATLKEAQTFSVFGEDVRTKTNKLRRDKK